MYEARLGSVIVSLVRGKLQASEGVSAMAKVSSMVRGASMAADVWARLDRAVKEQGGNDEDLHLLAKEEGQTIVDAIAAMLIRAGAAARNTYPVTVDYGKSLQRMIEAGKYNDVNSDINDKNFPTAGDALIKTEVVLVHFKRDISTEDAEKGLDEMGLRPATLPELLAFGATFPDIQREFPIIALGSVWVGRGGDRFSPSLGYWGVRRRLNLDWIDRKWTGSCRFAAVRK